MVLHFVHLARMESDRIDCTSTLTTISFSFEVLAIVTYMIDYVQCRLLGAITCRYSNLRYLAESKNIPRACADVRCIECIVPEGGELRQNGPKQDHLASGWIR